jgi:predicted methyltransferase
MRSVSLAAVAFAVAALVAGCASTQKSGTPDYIAAAIADAARPDKDRERDADRKPAEIMALTGLKPGDRVVDVGPGAGYYLRIMSRIVGANGKAIGFIPSWVAEKFPTSKDVIPGLVAAGYTNVEGAIQPMAEMNVGAPVDVVFMSQVYHDQSWQKIDVAKMNQAIFASLKPGGVYFIIDHAAVAGADQKVVDELHRIDPARVKAEILAAGFVLEAESDLLRNPADSKTINVFKPEIRGKTDQFVFKFRKPKK